jgi:hypothetical protein
VTHNIKRGEFKQSFQLSRDGLILEHAEGNGMSEASSDESSGASIAAR